MGLNDIYRIVYPKAAEYTIFSSSHGKLSKMDHMSEHKISLNKFKKIEILSNILSDHNDIKLEINDNEKNKQQQQKNSSPGQVAWLVGVSSHATSRSKKSP